MFSFTPINKAISIALFTVGVFSSTSIFAMTEYVSSETYEKNSEVTYNGVTYVARWGTTGKEPGVYNVWAEAMDIEWVSTVKYAAGSEITYNGITYIASWSHTGKTPGTSGVWKEVTIGGSDEWLSTTKYATDAEVTYNGVTYRASWAHKGKTPGVSGVWKEVTVIGTGSWIATVKYEKGAEVTYNSVTYTANWAHKGKTPGVAGVWKEVIVTGTEPWTATVKYEKNDEVIYNGVIYVASWNNTGKEPGTTGGVWRLKEGDVNSSLFCKDPIYNESTTYIEGDIVQNNEVGYECNIAAWCSSAPSYYEPGSGSDWESAWTEVKECPAQVTNVTFTTPVKYSAYLQNSVVQISVDASSTDVSRSISSVDFYANDVLLTSDTTAPFTATYTTDALGIIALKAIAKDNEGVEGIIARDITVSDKPVVVSFSKPIKGKVSTGNTIEFVVNATSIPSSITKVDFYLDGQFISSDTQAPYRADMTFIADGEYDVSAIATDANANTTEVIKEIKASSIPPLADRVVIGYWHNFDNGSGFPLLPEVSSSWDMINVSFAEPVRESTSEMTLEIQTKLGHSEEQMISDIKFVQARGQKVLISIGGANAHVHLQNDTERDEFVETMIALIEKYGFDGFDIDLEGGGTLSLDTDDKDFRNPTTTTTINMIAASKAIIAHFDGDLILTMAPETLYVQSGFRAYGPLEGAYLPIIHALREELTVLHVQLYNTGSINALDGSAYTQGTADFLVSMTEMMMTGFQVGDHFFPPLLPQQIALGIPSVPSAAPSGGFIAADEVHKALDYLIKGESFGGKYELVNPEGYNNLRGVMTWSVNWDRANGNVFVNSHSDYMNNLPPIIIPCEGDCIDATGIDAWDDSLGYNGGIQVLFEGSIYEANAWSEAGNSPTDVYPGEAWKNGKWTLIGEADPATIGAVGGGGGSGEFTVVGSHVEGDDGVMWTKDVVGANQGWPETAALCDNLSLDGYNDWRMPTVDELGQAHWSMIDSIEQAFTTPRYAPNGTQSGDVSGTYHFCGWNKTWSGAEPNLGWFGPANKKGTYCVRGSTNYSEAPEYAASTCAANIGITYAEVPE